MTECHTFPSEFSYSAYVWHFCSDDTENKKQIFFFFIFICFDSNSNLFGNSKMKFEYVNVRDRESKWFKGPENLLDIGKSSR